MSTSLILVIAGVGILIAVTAFVVSIYNRLVALSNANEEAWAQISVQLKRRHDLIPNLVSIVKGYARHETSTLEAVIAARTAAVNADSDAQHAAGAGAAEFGLSAALGKLFALSEAYPDLKANTNFLECQQELVDTENRISFARQYYNDSVRELNTRLATVPDVFVAKLLLSVEPAQYFEIEDRSHAGLPEGVTRLEAADTPVVRFDD